MRKKHTPNIVRCSVVMVLWYVFSDERSYLFLVISLNISDIANAHEEFVLCFPHGGFLSLLQAARMVK